MDKDIEQLRDLDLEIEQLKARKEEIKAKALAHRDTVTDEELTEAKTAIDGINAEIKEKEEKRSEVEAHSKQNKKEERKGEIKSMDIREKLASMEYREAFMKYVQTGVASDVLEKRVDSKTTTSTAATVIPTTIVNEIIKKAAISGNVLPKVRKTNLKGGVEYPTLSVRPKATWITEDSPSSRQALSTSKVSFSYYGLECKISQSLLSEYVSVEAFEAEFVTLAVEAMVNAKEIAIFNGSGSGQPKGILKETGVVETKVDDKSILTYAGLKKALSGLKASYRVGAELYMAQDTWDKIDAIVDTQGQPVARVNYGLAAGEGYTLFGYKVNIVETDRIKDYDTASADTDFVMVLGNMDNYVINGNGNIGVRKYVDEDKNENVTKVLEFLDGKPLQPEAFLRVKKVTSAGAKV